MLETENKGNRMRGNRDTTGNGRISNIHEEIINEDIDNISAESFGIKEDR